MSSKNGQAKGNSYLLVFDLRDDTQSNAWNMAQQLSSTRSLKSVLISMLSAAKAIQDKTGKEINTEEMVSQFVASMSSPEVGLGARRVMVHEGLNVEDLPGAFLGTTDHTSAEEARENFALSMGDLMAEDDDIWS